MKMYKAIQGYSPAHSTFRLLWKTACCLRHKIFFWLLLHDGISTRNMLHRRSMYHEDYNCALCAEINEETVTHLFWDCLFALMCWHSITPNKNQGMPTYDEIYLTLESLPSEFAMDTIVMGCGVFG